MLTDDETDRALCEAHCNTASDEYFNSRPQIDSQVNRRIFYAGHRKAWLQQAEATAPLLARIAELERFKGAYDAWQEKTEWVQTTATAGELGKHRADVLRERIEKLKSALSAASVAQPMTEQEIAYGFEAWQSSPAPEGWHFESDKTRARVAFMDGIRYAEKRLGIKEQP